MRLSFPIVGFIIFFPIKRAEVPASCVTASSSKTRSTPEACLTAQRDLPPQRDFFPSAKLFLPYPTTESPAMPENYTDTEAKIEAACQKIFELENPNVAAIAREFEVPVSRLRARLSGRQSRTQRPAPNKRLSEDEELAVCLYLKRLDSIGTSARLPMVTGCANAILRRNHQLSSPEPNTPPPNVGATWTARFLERNPQFYIRKQKTLDLNRKRAHDPDDLLDWFQRYKLLRDEKGIQDSDQYNFDETGFRIGIGKDQWIVTLDPSRQSYLASSSNRELVTSCEAVSGDGDSLPPMLILPGTLHLEDWYTKTDLDDDFLLAVSETGYSNDELSLEWLHHFDKFSARRQVGVYRLLLLDGHGSHCTKEFIDYCDEKKIIPFCLPPHSTHLLQPLDVVVFQPLKHYHTEAVEQATRSGCSDFNKLEFLSAISSIRKQAFKKSTILSSFRKTGLIPYNPETVLGRLREHTTPSHQTSLPEPHTPPPLLSKPISTPHTLNSLARHAHYLYQADVTSPTFRNSLDSFIKGSLAQAHLAAQVQEDLEHTQAAELARANRQKRSRRSVQKGGVMYAGQARAIARKREEEDSQKKLQQAQRQLERVQKAVITERKKRWKPVFQDLRKHVRKRNSRLKELERLRARGC